MTTPPLPPEPAYVPTDRPVTLRQEKRREAFLRLAPYLARGLREAYELCPAELGLSQESLRTYLVMARAAYVRIRYRSEWIKGADVGKLRALKFHRLANGNILIDKVDGRLHWRQRHREERIASRIDVLDSRPTVATLVDRVTVQWEDQEARAAALERAKAEPSWADSVNLSFTANANHIEEAVAAVKAIWPDSVRLPGRVLVVIN